VRQLRIWLYNQYLMWKSAWPKPLIHQRRAKSLERRTSNAQHRTLNIDDATLCRFYTQRTAESSVGQITSVNSLPDFVVTSAKQVYAVFFLIDRIPYSTLDVQCSMFDVHQFLFRSDRPFFWPKAPLLRFYLINPLSACQHSYFVSGHRSGVKGFTFSLNVDSIVLVIEDCNLRFTCPVKQAL